MPTAPQCHRGLQSDRQGELLSAYFRHVVLMLDGDDAGRQATDECLLKLGRRRYVRAVEVPEGHTSWPSNTC